MTPKRVAVVTGGGGGIGAAIARELGRRGDHVVTVDPLVSLDGSEQLPDPEETTAGRIVAAGGSAEASPISVTDRQAVRDLFDRLVGEFGAVDAVVNVAGISRPTSFARGTEADWTSVLEVHLDGYRNILDAALPHMAAAGRGRVLGVTSGSGWRPADTGAYGCAKRAVASLTWQLGRVAPDGVAVNAMSPIAVTRMVTAALAAAKKATGESSGRGAGAKSGKTGGLSLGSMPQPEELGPTGAHLVGDGFGWCNGHVIFVGGSEIAVVEPPRLIEVVRSDGAAPLASVFDSAAGQMLAAAEAAQATTGGSNPRLGPVFDRPAEASGSPGPPAVSSCVLITDRPDVGARLRSALEARGVAVAVVDATAVEAGFDPAADVLASTRANHGPFGAVVVATGGSDRSDGAAAWQRVLSEHDGIVDAILADARWARAVADHSADHDEPVRLVTVTDATTAGGRSRAQSAAHHARAASKATGERVSAFAIGLESGQPGDLDAAAALGAHLVTSPDPAALGGAELVVSTGYIGLRSHPRPSGSISFGGPDVPAWLDDALRSIVDPGAELQ